jgi:hypothetical protein
MRTYADAYELLHQHLLPSTLYTLLKHNLQHLQQIQGAKRHHPA